MSIRAVAALATEGIPVLINGLVRFSSARLLGTVGVSVARAAESSSQRCFKSGL